MSDRESFMRSIIAAPEDDAPRLVYADWLEEHGDEPEHAEFIRCQIKLARIEKLSADGSQHMKTLGHTRRCDRCKAEDKLPTLRAREKELADKYGETWISELLKVE